MPQASNKEGVGAVDLRGKVAVVTGGSRGLGLAIARGLSRAGATVAVASRKLAVCSAVADELIAAKGVKHGKLTVTTTGKDLPS